MSQWFLLWMDRYTAGSAFRARLDWGVSPNIPSGPSARERRVFLWYVDRPVSGSPQSDRSRATDICVSRCGTTDLDSGALHPSVPATACYLRILGAVCRVACMHIFRDELLSWTRTVQTRAQVARPFTTLRLRRGGLEASVVRHPRATQTIRLRPSHLRHSVQTRLSLFFFP